MLIQITDLPGWSFIPVIKFDVTRNIITRWRNISSNIGPINRQFLTKFRNIPNISIIWGNKINMNIFHFSIALIFFVHSVQRVSTMFLTQEIYKSKFEGKIFIFIIIFFYYFFLKCFLFCYLILEYTWHTIFNFQKSQKITLITLIE